MKFLCPGLIVLFILFGFTCTALSKEDQPAKTHPLAGTWFMHLTTSDVGRVRTIMNLEVSENGFEGHSRKNADKAIIGLPKATLARIFTKSFKHGALLHLEKGKIKQLSENEYKVAAILASASGRYLFQGSLKNNRLEGKLTNGKGEDRGSLTGEKGDFKYPVDDYKTVAETALKLTKAKIFNKEQVETKAWQNFEKAILETAGNARDDLDLVFGFFYFAQDLPFSHFALYREDPAVKDQDSAEVKPKERYVTLETLQPNVSYLKIASFSGTATEIDSVFTIIKQQQLPNLIIDLRGNSGGNISGLKVVTNLADKPYSGGAFVTNKWFEKNKKAPTVADFGNFQTLTEANLALLWDGIHNLEGLAIKVIPETTIYKGKVFVLTDGVTASTCEPIVYGLKNYQLATIVGERTAGAMLNGESFKVKESWQITIPTADYFTADGKRLDKIGVEPDHKVKASDALTFVLKKLVK